jgi:hypothetical protein
MTCTHGLHKSCARIKTVAGTCSNAPFAEGTSLSGLALMFHCYSVCKAIQHMPKQVRMRMCTSQTNIGIPSSQRHAANASKNAHCSICVLYCAVADRRQFFCSCKLATQESESACPLSSIVLNIFLLLCLFPDEDLTAQHSSE